MKKKVILLCYALVCLSLMVGVDSLRAEPIKLVFSAFVPSHHIQFKDVIEPWAANIEQLTGGKVKFSLHPGAELGPAQNQYDMVLKGEADLALGLPAYTPDRFPLSSVFELPLLVKNAEAGSIVLWEIFNKWLRDEFKDVKVLWLFVHSPGQVLSKKPIKSLADIKGMKIRSPGVLTSKTIEKLGGVPVNAPISQAYNLLAANEVEAVVAPWESFISFKFHEQCRFATAIDMYVMPFYVIMNKEKYETLPDDVKRIIDQNSGDKMSVVAGRAFDQGEAPAKVLFEQQGGQLIRLSPDELQQWRQIALTIGDYWVEDMMAKGLPGVEVLTETINLLVQVQ